MCSETVVGFRKGHLMNLTCLVFEVRELGTRILILKMGEAQSVTIDTKTQA